MTVTWTVTGASSSSGCETVTISEDTAERTLTCTATSFGGGQTSRTVTIKRDATRPEVSLTAQPASPTTTTTATFAFTGSDNLTAVTFECSLDDAAFAPCTSPREYAGLSLGSRTFAVRSRDEAGNVSFTRSYTWVIEAEAEPEPEPLVCDAGTYADGGACVPAPAGSFVAESGATSATLCAPGTFQPVEGQTSCTPAEVGFYVDEIGATSATACPAGTTTSDVGSVSADACIQEGGDVFDFTGFFAPIRNDGVNVAQAGRAIPVKFSLGGDQGLDIFMDGSPNSQVIACSAGVPEGAVEGTTTAGRSSLSYDPQTQQYTYVWRTERSWGNTCRRLTVEFTDGTVQSVDFRFNR
ncbi:MAG: hypothetical protein EA350_15310 [Gemmatimonadales bacterium]|nr:MAG: hypothetical protein EA350_15310 [Gemmatimonadales bacterium]